MNKQELLTQADYTFQRGNRALAQKYVADVLAIFPNDEAAWMLLARIVVEKERKVECYQRVLKINSNNTEAKISLARLSVSNTLPRKSVEQNQFRNLYFGVITAVVLFLLFGTTSFVIARNNPNSQLAKLLPIATPEIITSTLADDVASQTRAEVSEVYPQYSGLVDALIGYAVENADTGLEGAPERPGDEIRVSSQSSTEAKDVIMNALPQAGTLSSITITEQQATSWLATAMKNSPDLPLQDVQVYLRNGQIQVWGMITGSADSTSALIVAEIKVDNNQKPYFEIISMQIGTQVVPDFLLGQMEAWLNQALIENINEQLPGLSVMNVNVGNGLITVSGMR